MSVRDSEDFSSFVRSLQGGLVDTIVFTSASGVKATLELAESRGLREKVIDLIGSSFVISIGPHTAAPLNREGLKVSFVPDEYSSSGIVSDVPREAIGNKNVWVLRSNHGSRGLIEGLLDLGANLREVVVYDLDRNLDGDDVLSMIDEGGKGRIDAFAFTSSLSASTFIEASISRLGEEETMSMLSRSLIGAIGEPTRERLEGLGVRVDAVPDTADFGELLVALHSRR
jgi:uroporphyrinogen-III synthase